MSLVGSCCLPRILLGNFGSAGLVFALAASRFFFACQLFAHFLRCSCQVIVYTTSTFAAAVALLIPTYKWRKFSMGEAVSEHRTTPGKVKPCTEE